MTPKEIKEELQKISNKMGKNSMDLWGSELDETYQVILVENHPDVKYNGWSEDLENLIKKIS